ncbi:hypothetical protein C8Q73DRAFT_648627, partial [Cubamyces lactineus]
QLDVAEALLLGIDCTVIATVITGTGLGKTTLFVLPSLVETRKVYVIVSPLNASEADQAKRFKDIGVSAAVLNGNTCTATLLKIQCIVTEGRKMQYSSVQYK